ncbi:MAG: type II toxin-antitoxin system RatA family toxin [Vulcanimicrobiota bacterium]
MPYVETKIFIKTEPVRVYEMACNMEEFPEFMKDVEEVNVLERNANSTITEWVSNVDGTPLIWTEEDIFDDKSLKITYRLIEGDLDKFEGEWEFKQKDGGCEVILGVDYDFGMPSLTELIGPTLKEKVKENSEMMLIGMKEKLEAK